MGRIESHGSKSSCVVRWTTATWILVCSVPVPLAPAPSSSLGPLDMGCVHAGGVEHSRQRSRLEGILSESHCG